MKYYCIKKRGKYLYGKFTGCYHIVQWVSKDFTYFKTTDKNYAKKLTKRFGGRVVKIK